MHDKFYGSVSEIFDDDEPFFHKGIQCYVRKLKYNFKEKRGTLFLGEHSSPDMTGCIKIFQKIDPKVVWITTVAGKGMKQCCNFYILTDGKWKACED